MRGLLSELYRARGPILYGAVFLLLPLALFGHLITGEEAAGPKMAIGLAAPTVAALSLGLTLARPLVWV